LIVSLAMSSRTAAQEVSRNPETQDIYLSFSFSGLVNTVVTAVYYQDSVYIPVSAVFKQLRIDNTVGISTSTLKGFYIQPSNLYDINFGTGVARINGEEIRFDTSKVIVGQIDFYVLPSFFERVFGLNLNVDFNSLSLVLNTDQPLPVVEDYQRQMRRNYLLVSPEQGIIQAPLAYPRHRSLLNGGILDYSLSAYNGGGQSAYNYEFTGGAEILGGETEGSLQGTVSNGTSALNASSLAWKYTFDSTGFISYAGLGNLYSDGLTQYGYRGAQVSNQPLTVRTLFGSYLIRAKTDSNWDVELYLNGQLVGYRRADSQGRAEFSVPLVYGTSFIQLKYYGPNGEFREEDRRLQIPFTFVPAGVVNYTVSAGKLNNTDYNLLSGNVIFGLTDWLSDKIGMDYVDSPLFSKPLFYNSLSLRFGPEYSLSIDAAPDAFYRSTFSALYASQAAFDVSYDRYRDNLLYNPSFKLQDAQADAYVPFTIGESGFNFRLAGSAVEYTGGQKSYSYSGYVSTNVSQLNASIGYLRSIIDYGGSGFIQNYSFTGTLLYSLFFQQGAFDFLNGTLINATARYGVLKNSPDDISLQLSKNLQEYVRVAVSAEHDYINKSTNFSLQIIADLPFTRSTTSAQFQSGAAWYTENLSGSVGFDSKYKRFLFNNLEWVGHSAASMRMFVDTNGDGRYENGEPVIGDGEITLRQAVASETSDDGIIREWNLLPYTQYSADVDLSTIRNPLWIPKQKSFSFITDPNSYKPIDVPFFVGGIVEGKVLRSEAGRLSAVAGLTLEIKSIAGGMVRTISVFNDGSFYYMGLPPGEYEARVDSAQLAVLGVYADPEVLNFTVKPTEDGDVIDGLTIMLRPKVPVPPPPEKKPAQTAVGTSKPVKYVVQLGAFTTPERAGKLARWARIRTGQILVPNFNPWSHLYVVQTDTFDSKSTALDRLDIFMNKFGFFDAFVTSTLDTGSHYLFSVQLAAFESMRLATAFAFRIKKETGISSVIQFKRSTRLFSVMAGPFASETEAEELMDRLKKRADCREAFIVIDGQRDVPQMYVVSLAGFRNRYEADWFANSFRWRTGLIALVGFDFEEMKFQVFTPSFRTEAEALAALTKIQSFSGYTAARIVSIP
jgi:SPOR domain